MAFYYCYQQQQPVHSEPQPPQSTAPELNTPLPSFLLLSSRPPPPLTMPMLTPILPSVSMATTVATSEYNEQQQLPTPNTFIRHCEDIGLFHDLQNVVVMSPLAGPFDDTVATTLSASTADAMNSAITPKMFTTTAITTPASTENTSSSNSFGSLSTSVLKTMMMANPFDETFKQAMLLQQKKDANLAGNHLNNSSNNDNELNTPFIATTTNLDTTKMNYMSANEVNSDLVTASSTAELITIEPKQLNLNIVPSPAEMCTYKVNNSVSSDVLMTMVEQKKQQEPHSIVFPQNQLPNHYISKNRTIAPATMLTTDVVDITTTNCEFQNINDDVGGDKSSNKCISNGSESTKVKQVLKHNLMEKQMQQEPLKPYTLSTNHVFNDLLQENNGVDVVSTTTAEQDSRDEIQKNQTIEEEKKRKQDQLERNRSAAKRSRLKRKQKWELLSEENRRLKIENIRLHKIILKLTGQ